MKNYLDLRNLDLGYNMLHILYILGNCLLGGIGISDIISFFSMFHESAKSPLWLRVAAFLVSVIITGVCVYVKANGYTFDEDIFPAYFYVGEMKKGNAFGFGRIYELFEREDRVGKYWYQLIYKGGFKDNEFHGKGTIFYDDGRWYTGKWKEGKRFGDGVMYYENGDWEEQSYRDDVLHGLTTYHHKNGSVRVMEFHQGERVR